MYPPLSPILNVNGSFPLTQHLIKTFGKDLEYKHSREKYSDGWFLTILHPKGDKTHVLKKLTAYLERDI